MHSTSASIIELNDNGAWSCFSDPRAVVHGGRLLVGSVRCGRRRGALDKPAIGAGNCELIIHDLASGSTDVIVLHAALGAEADASPALLVRPDGRVVALYAKNAQERCVYWRISESEDLLEWTGEQRLITPGEDSPTGRDHVAFGHAILLPGEKGRSYHFVRAFARQACCLISEDHGESWRFGGALLRASGDAELRVQYASDGRETIHFVVTEGDAGGCVYHGDLRDGRIFGSDGTVIAHLSEAGEAPVEVSQLTRVLACEGGSVASVIDVRADAQGRAYGLLAVHKANGQEMRYHYARWDGARWVQEAIAHAGQPLGAGAGVACGGAVIDPQDPTIVYISTNADPVSGQALTSQADRKRHYELFRGQTADGGATWAWSAITENSSADNLRPIMPPWDDPRGALVWLRGRYDAEARLWRTEVVGMLESRSG